MKLLFKQRLFSWFDSYDIYDENGQTLYIVKGELSWGHQLRIYDAHHNEVGMIKQKLLTFLPQFDIYVDSNYVGSIKREFSFLKPIYNIDFNQWHIEGDYFGWDYSIFNNDNEIARISKELWNWTDTYTIDVNNPHDALYALMLVLAIDAEKCSHND